MLLIPSKTGQMGQSKGSGQMENFYGQAVQKVKQIPNTQNLIPIHKTQFEKTKLNKNTQNFSKTQNSISKHKARSQFTKLNPNTQSPIPIHKTQFENTKLNTNTQNLSKTQNSISKHKARSRFTQPHPNTQNSISKHKSQSQYTKPHPNITKLNLKTQNSIKIHKTFLRPRLHESGSDPDRIQKYTDRPCAYKGPLGSVYFWIRYPNTFGIAFESDPVWIQSSLCLVKTGRSGPDRIQMCSDRERD